MNLCSDDHDEICYEGSFCPACKILEAAKERESGMQAELDDLKDQLEEATTTDAKSDSA